MGLIGLSGYATYAASKHAIHGLAACLRQELAPSCVSVHVYYPGTILSPGFDEEQKVKPEITKILEGGSPELTPAQAAAALWSGIKRGQFAIVSDFNGHLIRARALGIKGVEAVDRQDFSYDTPNTPQAQSSRTTTLWMRLSVSSHGSGCRSGAL